MITRYNWKWKKPDVQSEPVKVEWELVKIIEPISFNEDKSVKEYKEREEYVKHESLWADFIKSFDLGSVSEQVINHLTKGTPLITAHTLPDGDYTDESLLRGAEIRREMQSKGITLEMIIDALKTKEDVKQESEVINNG